MPSVKFLFAWRVLPVLALLVACAHGSSDEPMSEAEQLSTLYQRTCGGRTAQACFEQAERLRAGDGVAKDEARAATLHELGCNGGERRACVALGVLKEEGRGVAKDEAEAARLYARGCEQGLPEGCGHLALLYGEGRGVAKDLAQAVRFYERGCEGDDGLSCNNLGVLKLMGGFGVTQDVAAGMGMLVQACNRNVGVACLTVAREFDQGVRTRKDARLAASYFRTACGMGEQEACASASAAVAPKPEPAPAVTPEEGAKLEKIRAMCETGSGVALGMACYVMGTAYEKGASVAVNPGRATMYYQRACDHEVPEACGDVRRMLGLTVDGAKTEGPKRSVLESLQLDPAKVAPEKPKQSVLESLQLDPAKVAGHATPPRDPIERWTQECQGGRGKADACGRLGEVLLWGSSGQKPDVAKALLLLEQACNRRGVDACLQLWRAWSLGHDFVNVPKDERKGLAMLELGCAWPDGGAACERLGDVYMKEDLGRAVKTWQSSCFEQEDSTSCAKLMIITRKLANNGPEALRENAAKALPLYQAQGCKARMKDECTALGLPMPKDVVRVRRLKEACDAGDPDACGELAQAYQQGREIEWDRAEEIRVAAQGCDGGSAEACVQLAKHYRGVRGGAPLDLDAMLARAGQACSLKSSTGCGLKARFLEEFGKLTADAPQVREARYLACLYLPEARRSGPCEK
ncbi:sel1 repeat family protein [Corallococcus exercitus]|uniref:Sel1 repeat family protein n=1 Tax=Corallococcus exercitus TaxID=2316736 RepID=A0A7Y4KHN2_9BACT|nr:SEL1-like repeat protein [Corallococcus exercitus]NOK33837.1 sel1 repeat family protein [Corallococcus exercitus]